MGQAVYFIASKFGRGPIKIGKSHDPRARLQSLQTATHEELMLIGVMLGGSIMERRIHKHFQEFRIRGEWFRPDKKLLKFIYANGEPYDIEFICKMNGVK